MAMILTYPEALNQVKAQVAASRSSFHAGMAILPKARREGMYALYGFCRAVDDIADDSLTSEIAAQGLIEWRRKIADLFQGNPTDAITTALLPAIKQFGLIEQEFMEIIEGMEMDSVAIVAPDMKRLDLYCDRVASAVGRVSVRIFGDASADAMQVAWHQGRALQLTNILRDIAEDVGRGRLYLPRELLEKHGIASRQPQEVLRDAQLPAVCRDLAAVTRGHYSQTDVYMKKCKPTAMRPARIMRSYYGAVFERLVQLDWQDPMTRVRLTKWRKAGLMLKGYFA